jgi:hypothetical protein
MLLAISASGAFLYGWMMVKPPPKLDQTSYCPLDGAYSIMVILIDTSDPLPDPAVREVKTKLFDTADTLKPYALLEIRVLDAAGTGHVKRRMITIDVEYTDTFGGVANYSWVKREAIAEIVGSTLVNKASVAFNCRIHPQVSLGRPRTTNFYQAARNLSPHHV